MPFSVLSRECSLDAHGLLRFRTNDVLLGTSGVGVCMSVVSNSPGIFIFINYYFYAVYSRPPAPPIISSASSAGRQLDGRVASGSNRQGDPYNFFHLSGPNFALGASYDSIQRSQAVAWCVVSFSSRESDAWRMSCCRTAASPASRASSCATRSHRRSLP